MRGALSLLALCLLACSAAGGALGEPGGDAGAEPRAEPSGGAPAASGGASSNPNSGGQTASGAAGATGQDAASPVGPTSNGSSITCPGAPCQAPLQHCCINGEGSGNPPLYQCIPSDIGCGLSALERMCDAGEDCGDGQVCCADTAYPSTPSKCRSECLSGEQPTCWTGAECGAAGTFCCFFPGRPAGFCNESAHAGATLCVK